MNKVNWLLSAFILGLVFLFGCSSDTTSCRDTEPSSSSVKTPPSSSSVGMEDQRLVKKNITLSLGSSYADIDGEPAVYTKAEAANNLDKVDLIAYCGTDIGCENNSIYSPRKIDLFWNPKYIGSETYLFEIPDEHAGIFKTAKNLSEIIPTLNILIGIFNGTSGVEEISIAVDKTFLVYTPENIRVVIIKETGEQSVGLEIILIPSN